MIGRVARAVLDLAERALSTPVPEPIDRACPNPACGESLRFWCREIRREGTVQEVRCLCGTHSVWDWQGRVPYLVQSEAQRRQVAA